MDRKPDWRNPPTVTLIILVINVLFFYIWQANDNNYVLRANEYYQFSGLYKIELKAYDAYRKFEHKLTNRDLDRGTPLLKKRIREMAKDQGFQNKLEADQIIKPGDSGYTDWRGKRNHYDYLNNKVVSNKYGFTPANPSFITYFTSMFLHGGNLHLWGNMFFLVVIGYVVEMLLGHTLYLIGYLFSGLTASWLFMLLFPHSYVHGIGASGAISGIMGMYMVLFGLRKVKFFYTLFVYFDYVRAPAIVLVPFFFLYLVIIPYFLDPNINISAHAGGFFGGILFAGVLKFIPGTINMAYLDEDKNEDQFHADYQQALQLLVKMEIDEAREKFEMLLKQRPGDVNLKQQLYNVSKYNPASEPYHRYALQLLNLSGADRATIKIIHDTFTDYANRAKPKPRWTPALLISMATRFAAAGFLDDAEKLVNFMLKAKTDFSRNSEGLAALVKYFNGKDKQKADHYLQLLLQHYPHSNEAQHLLKSSGLPVSE